MTKHEADVIGGLNMTDQISNEAYKQIMIAAQDENEPCEDCISRQAAIDALLGITAMRNTIPLDSAIFNIKKLPSAQPERKTGRWIPDNTDYYRTKFICSACGKSEEVPTTGFGYGTMWDYCPYCGAKMTESEDKA